jgi:hypothetical protein
MSKIAGLLLGVLVLLGGSLIAQQYRCDWSVNGIGGGEMSSAAYRCGATAGQTAAGFITASNYWALIGYWLPEGEVGVREQAQWPSGQALVTRLYAPQPNPFRTHLAIRYSLAADGLVSLAVHDITGRVVRQLCASSVKRGAHSVTWDGRDNAGRTVAAGVYFCRFTAGDYDATQKLVVQR